MQPHEQRVVDEKRELDEKLGKLNALISDSPIFGGLPDQDRMLMLDQRDAMGGYSAALEARIERFADLNT